MNKNIITRFAPSPTGYLHLGGARTALFNWLYAKQNNGKFFIRFEDTDNTRNIDCEQQILDDLSWLGLSYDEIYKQSENLNIHMQIAYKLLDLGAAYRCYLTETELENIRNNGQKIISPWRNSSEVIDAPYVIRIKAPLNHEWTVKDNVQGLIKVKSEVLDDFVILRSNKRSTYIFASMVDDYLQNITDIIRGTDHLTNTVRQQYIHKALQWKIPNYYHIPLIADSSGAKLSKRTSSLTIIDLKKNGYIPAGILNTCARLGWSKGNLETITIDHLLQVFNLEDLNKSQARFDEQKLDFFNSYHLKQQTSDEILSQIESNWDYEVAKKLVSEALKRAKTLKEIKELLEFCNLDFVSTKADSELLEFIQNLDFENIETEFKKLTKIKAQDFAINLRKVITGKSESIGIYQILSA